MHTRRKFRKWNDKTKELIDDYVDPKASSRRISLFEQIADFQTKHNITDRDEINHALPFEVYKNKLDNSKLDEEVKEFFLLRHFNLFSPPRDHERLCKIEANMHRMSEIWTKIKWQILFIDE